MIKKYASGIKNENISNKELAQELHKTIIRKFNNRKVHLPFIGNIWGADLGDMQPISKFDKRFRFLLCVIDICSEYAWIIPLNGKKGIIITNAFHKILNESNCRGAKSKGHKENKIGKIKAVSFIIDQWSHG